MAKLTSTTIYGSANVTGNTIITGNTFISTGSGLTVGNGNTAVTSLVTTVQGYGYATQPTITISPPTTFGGVTATANVRMYIDTATVAFGGTGYNIGDVLTVVGGNPVTVAATLTVTGNSSGVITTVSSTNFNAYHALPTSPVSVTGGSGTGATLTPAWATVGGAGATNFNIINPGSGYVSQPTVTFSSGSAAAYAVVGGASFTFPTIIKGLGSTLDFFNASGRQLQLADSAGASTYLTIRGDTANRVVVGPAGGSNPGLVITTGTGTINFQTGSTAYNQFVVSHTASSNWFNATGAALGSGPILSTGAAVDANVAINITPKGNAAVMITGNTVGYIPAANSIYVGNRIGFANSNNISVMYQFYNQATGTMDVVFG